jgi:hypothetical protein
MEKERSGGQALLLVVLAVAVMTTVGLSVASRSISDVTLTTREEESLRAFSAAEAGIEEALISGLSSGELPEGASFSVTSSGFPDASSEYIYPLELASGEVGTLWFLEHDVDLNLVGPSYKGQTVDVCWGKEGTSGFDVGAPAVEVEVFYESGGEVQIARGVYDPNAMRRSENNFSDTDGGTCTVDGRVFAFRKALDFGAGGLNLPYGVEGGLKAMRVTLLYNDSPHSLGFLASQNLPSQGSRVESMGVSGQSTRRVEVVSLYPSALSVFGSALYSESRID